MRRLRLAKNTRARLDAIVTWRLTLHIVRKRAVFSHGRSNEFYRKKDFVNATQHYQAALELDPEDITYLNNLAGTRLRQCPPVRTQACTLPDLFKGRGGAGGGRGEYVAVQFEKGEYDACIKTCEQAIEKGREVRADFKLVARCARAARFGSRRRRGGSASRHAY